MLPEDTFWGDRYGMLEDPFGHRWSIATPQRSMSVKEVQEAASVFFDKGEHHEPK